MIDQGVLETQLTGLPLRSNRRFKAEEWGTGDMGVPDELLPDVNTHVKATLRRLAGQAQSLGPRIVTTKRFGTIGDVNWGGDDPNLDQIIRLEDLEGLASDLLDHSLYSGLMVGIARRDPDTGDARIEPMLGHVEPVYSPSSPTMVAGMLHAWVEPDSGARRTWTVRLYDLKDRTLLEWNALNAPQDLARRNPDAVVGRSAEYPDGAPVPRFAIVGRDAQRFPKGDMAKLLPLLYADWSSQVRGSRIEESTAIPQLVVKGDVEDGTSERSPTHVLRLLDDGDAKYLVPGDMTTLHERHNRILERVREDGNLPGGFLGSQTPSGEALREANAKFISANRWVAARLSRVLTELVQDLAQANGQTLREDVQVVVQINREFTRAQDIEDTTRLHAAGLIPTDAATRHITPFIPTWSDEDVEEFLATPGQGIEEGAA